MTPISDNIDLYNLYVHTCSLSSTIRTVMTVPGPGNLINTFREFKYDFDLLFMLTYHHKDIVEYNVDIVNRVQKWLSVIIKGPPPNKFIVYGLELFREYTKALVSHKIIVVGKVK